MSRTSFGQLLPQRLFLYNPRGQFDQGNSDSLRSVADSNRLCGISMRADGQNNMPAIPDYETPESAKTLGGTMSIIDTHTERKERRSRPRLNCTECRKKKLSCDRKLPCRRCIRSARPQQCSYDTETGRPPLVVESGQEQEQHNSAIIQGLRAEVAELRSLLSRNRPAQTSAPPEHVITIHESKTNGTKNFVQPRGSDLAGSLNQANTNTNRQQENDIGVNEGLSDPSKRTPRGFYSQHALFRFFVEMPDLFPFIKETSDEWLRPLGVHITKAKSNRKDRTEETPLQQDDPLDSLVPAKQDTDYLVSFYLENLEQLHRVVHVPTFKAEYVGFWQAGRSRHPAMAPLILAMISISTCIAGNPSETSSIPMRHRARPVQWISACDRWLGQQGSKHRKLVHYQVSILVYLAKRVNVMRKKTYWRETGAMVQNAIMDGLHCDPSPTINSPYTREMKRRIWTTIRELDLHNSFEHCLPTLLHTVDSDIVTPANIDDDAFDAVSGVSISAKATDVYTDTSYQHQASSSWSVRLEISRRLFCTKAASPLSFEEVMMYTHKLTQILDSLPTWQAGSARAQSGTKTPDLAHVFLQFQLKECLLALHRPYIQNGSGTNWLSETICYHTARDILLLNIRLGELGLQGVTVLRDDLLLAALSLARLTMIQPQGSMNFILHEAESTICLMDQCLPFFEEAYLRCCYGEPWCFLTMNGAIMLLKIHLGKESRESAKSSCAHRFLDLHHKRIGRQQTSLWNKGSSAPQEAPSQIPGGVVVQPGTQPDTAMLPISGWFSETGIHAFDMDMDIASTWDSWDPPWPESPSQSAAAAGQYFDGW